MAVIYLCRHGETQWSKSGQHTGLTDLELTDNGRKQASSLGKKIHGILFSKVLISPLKRAKETARLAHLHGEIDPDLLEWNYGEYEGLTTKEIHQKDPTWNIFTHGGPGGESINEIKVRALRLIKKVKAMEGNVCLVSSGHISRAIGALWLGEDVSFGRYLVLSTASISKLGFEHENPAILGWNDTSHLDLKP